MGRERAEGEAVEGGGGGGGGRAAMRDRRGGKPYEAGGDSSSSSATPRRSARRPPRPPKRKEKCCCTCSRRTAAFWLVFAAVVVCVAITALLVYGRQWIAVAPKPRALTPFPGKLVSDLPQVSETFSSSRNSLIPDEFYGILGNSANRWIFSESALLDFAIGAVSGEVQRAYVLGDLSFHSLLGHPSEVIMAFLLHFCIAFQDCEIGSDMEAV